VNAQPGEPVADGLQRCGGNNRGTVGDVVVGETFGRMANYNLLLEIDAEPLRGVFSTGREGKRPRGNVAAVAGNRERDRAEIRRIRGADQMHGGRPLGVDPAAIDREECPSTVVLEPAAGS